MSQTPPPCLAEFLAEHRIALNGTPYTLNDFINYYRAGETKSEWTCNTCGTEARGDAMGSTPLTPPPTKSQGAPPAAVNTLPIGADEHTNTCRESVAAGSENQASVDAEPARGGGTGSRAAQASVGAGYETAGPLPQTTAMYSRLAALDLAYGALHASSDDSRAIRQHAPRKHLR